MKGEQWREDVQYVVEGFGLVQILAMLIMPQRENLR